MINFLQKLTATLKVATTRLMDITQECTTPTLCKWRPSFWSLGLSGAYGAVPLLKEKHISDSPDSAL
jgi:hypothetical protein